MFAYTNTTEHVVVDNSRRSPYSREILARVYYEILLFQAPQEK